MHFCITADRLLTQTAVIQLIAKLIYHLLICSFHVFQRDSTILGSLVGTDVVETSLPRYQHGVITVIRSACEKAKMHANTRLYWIRTNVSSIAASALATKLIALKVDNIMMFAVMHL